MYIYIYNVILYCVILLYAMILLWGKKYLLASFGT